MQSDTIQPGDPTIYSLQGLRAVAALMVVTTHLMIRLLKYEIIDSRWSFFLSIGGAGVCLFFIISGFIMVRTAGHRFGSPGASWDFVIRRFIRIAPVYYFFTFLYIAKERILGVSTPAIHLLKSMFFLPYVNLDGIMQPVYSLGWTLNYEIYFYVVFSICLAFPKVPGLFLLFIIMASVFGLSQIFTIKVANGDPQDVIGFYGHPITFYFLAGVAIGLLPKFIQPNFILCMCLSVLTLAIGIISCLPYVLAVCCSLSVLISTSERSYRQRPRFAIIAKEFGDASYSIYLTHSFIIGPMFAFGFRYNLLSGWFLVAYSVFCILFCALTGVVCHRIFEIPVLNYFKKHLVNSRVAGQLRS